MEEMKQVRWREGMFLRPHHFQQHELYREERERWLVRSLHPFGWGISELEIEQTQLDNYMLGVRTLRAVLPGGTVLDVPGNARLPGRDFSAQMREAGRPLPVLVGVRQREERVPEVADESSRFEAIEDEVHDLDTGRDPIPIERLRLRARIFVGDEPTHGYEVLPLLQLLRTGDTVRPVAVDRAFAPPSLALRAAAALEDATRRVADRVAQALREGREQGFGEEPLYRALRFQAASAAMPLIRETAENGLTHPYDAYRELARLLGALLVPERGRSVVTEDAIPKYDHLAPAAVFDQLYELLDENLKWVIIERFRRQPMRRTVDVFQATLPAEARQPLARVFLEIHAVESAPRLRDHLMRARISSPGNRIDFLTQSVQRGVPTEEMPGPPPELPPGSTGAYFRLKTDEGTEWQPYILTAGEMAVFILNTPADVKMNLIVIPPR